MKTIFIQYYLLYSRVLLFELSEASAFSAWLVAGRRADGLFWGYRSIVHV